LGSAWRLPTQTEWSNVDVAGNWTNWNGPFNSGLQMHAAGKLNTTTGSLLNCGIEGTYWSNKQLLAEFSLGGSLVFNNGESAMSMGSKGSGLTVRCVRD
jgi:hypothetical protein